MKHIHHQPFLQFNFTDQHNEMQPLTFTQPVQVITTDKIDEVLPCFVKIQQAIHEGYYVAGYISYEAAPAFDKDYCVHVNHHLPLIWFGVFKESTQSIEQSEQNPFTIQPWKLNISTETYNKHLNYIKKQIQNNKTKQVNYTVRLESEFSGNPYSYYKQLAAAQAANYSAYLDIGDYAILSASPELFFQVKGDKIITRPMKGTIERGKTYAQDQANKNWLFNSVKNRKENILIVEQMANELKKLAKQNTIAITNQYEIEAYPTVYQMTTTLSAQLQPNINFSHIFQTLFPSASITGTPKSDTMKIISEIERFPREVYCGAIGYITPNNEAIFSVPIRTVIINSDTKQALYGVGGGITLDSQNEEEYHEVLTKAELLKTTYPSFELLETFGLNNGVYLVFDEHLMRLKQSAIYFNFSIDLQKIKNDLLRLAAKQGKGSFRIRLLVAKDGSYSIESQTISPMPKNVRVKLAEQPIDKNNVFFYHKTSYRQMYEEHFEQTDPYFDALLWNKNEEITEFTIGNVVVEINGERYTPPVSCGLLAGTYREHLLKNGEIKEKIISLRDLKRCTNIWLINSVRQWVTVELDC